MPLKLLSIALLFLCSTSFAQDECLQSYKIGTFYYYTEGTIVTVKRTKTHQIEKFKGGKTECSIKWLDESSYQLTFNAAKSSPGCLKDGDMMEIKFTNCTEETITASITSKGCGSGSIQIYRSKKVLKKKIKKFNLK